MKNLILCLFLLTSSNIVFSDKLDKENVNSFVEFMYDKHGYNKSYLYTLFDEVKIEKKIKTLIKKAPEKKLTWNGCAPEDRQCINYKNLFVNNKNIENGKNFIKENKYLLERAYYQFGVPGEIITAIIGIETKYGKYLGNFKTFDTLASLSLAEQKGRRSNFYRTELENFLLLCRENNLDPRNILGSYAGALGKPQFISSSYRNYAIDFDNDGSVDLWQSNADVIGSVANYLKKNGWKKNGRILSKLSSDSKDAKVHSASMKSYKPHTRYKSFTRDNIISNESINPDEKLAIIRRQEGNKNVYSFGHNNFYTITRYNRSRLYALAVYSLAEELKK